MGCKDIAIRKSEFVAKTQFLCYTLDTGKFIFAFWKCHGQWKWVFPKFHRLSYFFFENYECFLHVDCRACIWRVMGELKVWVGLRILLGSIHFSLHLHNLLMEIFYHIILLNFCNFVVRQTWLLSFIVSVSGSWMIQVREISFRKGKRLKGMSS